jgi:cephalosporin-C deacetylase
MPLTFDFPLEKLQTYTGRNPKPRDFDQFWERGLDEMRKTDPALELRPASFKSAVADCFDMYFTGVGGARVHAKLLHPKEEHDSPGQKHPAVLMFHGYSGNAGDWYDKLGYVSQGFVVAAMDCRGQGGQSFGLSVSQFTKQEGVHRWCTPSLSVQRERRTTLGGGRLTL